MTLGEARELAIEALGLYETDEHSATTRNKLALAVSALLGIVDNVVRNMHERELHHFEAEQVIDRIRENLSNAPECDKHADDDPVTCGWKSDMLNVRKIINEWGDKS